MRRTIGVNVLILALLMTLAPREVAIDVGGVSRSYLVHVPKNRPDGPLPLVVLMHGGGGDAVQAMRAYRMNEVADREGFLVAYPNGSGRFEKRLLTWNAGNCCAYAQEHGVDDVRFIRAMVAKIGRELRVDPSRIYATGMSNGAMMAHRLGCEAPDLFAAIAPVAGALNIACRPADEVAVAIFHGTDDQHVPYNGGTGPKALNDRVDRPVSHAVDVWRKTNGCTKETPETKRGAVTRRSWTGCREGTEVTLFTIAGGGHAWPGGVTPPRRSADRP
ncbi:MAG TPA: PHB depolymerase family esterase, partial [Thermoanaerobaculia bacterium]|nr:PHB depolymerase family esterase [Thermoanaerobaculia bacterium]